MYKIIAVSQYGVEQIDETDTLKDARYMRLMYSQAFGTAFTIYIKKGRKII